MYYLQDELSFLLEPLEVNIIIDELHSSLKINNKWLNSIDTKIKISTNKVNIFSGKTIHELVKEKKEQNKYFESSLKYYNQKLITISN